MVIRSKRQRVVGVILLAIAVLAIANYVLELGVFGRFDRVVPLIVLLFAYVLFAHIWVDDDDTPVPRKFRGGPYVVGVLIMMALVAWLSARTFQSPAVSRADWIKLIVAELVVVVVGIATWPWLKRRMDGERRN